MLLYLYILFIINYLLTKQKLCGRNEISHCIECDNEQEICNKCENGYFVLFGGYQCLPCNDKQYGDPACEGNCDSSRYSQIQRVLCDKCKEGYYSIEGICTRCDVGSPWCAKCSYEFSLERNKKIYTCLECVDGLNGEYRVSKVDGICRRCTLPLHCLECRYKIGTNDVECIKCRNDYILIKNDYICKLPSEVNLNESCEEATRLENGHYSCNKCRNENYALIIRFNSINDCYPAENEILNCDSGYEDENNNLYCTKCRQNYYFIWNKEYQNNICDQCASDYFFNYDLDIPGCYKCDDENGGGQIGCNPKKGCSYIPVDNHLYCNSCKTGYFLNDWQCLTCSKKDINCIECDFNFTDDKFRCNKCKSILK